MTEKVNLPCAWLAEDLARDKSWIRPFTDAEIAEVEEALRYSKSKGLAEQAVTAEDFPLPTLSGTLKKICRDLDTGTGVVMLRGFPVANYSYDDLRRMYWGMGRHMGSLECQNTKGEYMQEI
ncbi:MAG: taurine catabolism dioxygenase TauD, partial [Rhodospirillales bacterium]